MTADKTKIILETWWSHYIRRIGDTVACYPQGSSMTPGSRAFVAGSDVMTDYFFVKELHHKPGTYHRVHQGSTISVRMVLTEKIRFPKDIKWLRPDR